MKIFRGLCMACCLGLMVLAACQRSQQVQAGSEGTTGGGYRPLSAPDSGVDLNRNPADGPLKGEVMSVDLGEHSMLIRVENGMQQTIKWNNSTTVNGIPVESKSGTTLSTPDDTMKGLADRPGSAVVIDAIDDHGQKIASVIQVTDLSSPSKQPKKRVRRIKNA